jgi:membrane-associated protease RseP (regulator of RpoE activity)
MSREIVHAVGRWRTNLWLVLSFTLAPVAEEVFFRGFLQNALGRRMRFGLALAIQVSLFTLIHDYHSLGLAAVAYIGFVLTLLYRWRGTLLTPILTHAGINLFFSLAIVATSLAFSSAPVIGISTSGEPNSVVVKEVLPGSGAEAAGIQTGDRITHVDNKPVRSLHELKAVLIPFRPGDWVVLTVKRDGDILYTSVELTAPKLE